MRWFKGKAAKDSRMFFTTDIHGSDRCFRKFLHAAEVYEAQTLVIGGDLTGKRLCPVVARPDGRYACEWAGRPVTLESARELEEFKVTAANAGLYAFECSAEEAAALERDPALVEERFVELAARRLADWVALAEDRLAGKDVTVIINCGNDDPFAFDPILDGSELVTFPEGRLVRIDDRRTMASVGYANRTPWDCARDVEEDELRSRIDAVVAAWDGGDDEHLVLNTHCPPYRTTLDQAAVLDEELRPVTDGGQVVIGPVGSTAVREAIELHQPLLALHGHIHESRGVDRIGRTLCINPGSEYPEGVLRGAIVDFDRNGVKGYVLTSS
jgi:Icc-related predicted phosphoesterase